MMFVKKRSLNLIDTEQNFNIFIPLRGQVVLLMPTDFRQQTEQRMFLHVIIHPACVSGATQIKWKNLKMKVFNF